MADPDFQKQIDLLEAKHRDLSSVVLFQASELKAVRAVLMLVAAKCGITNYKEKTLEETLVDLIDQLVHKNLLNIADEDPLLATKLKRLLEIGQSAADERDRWTKGEE